MDSYNDAFEIISQYSDEEKDILARCLIHNPEDDGTEANIALEAYEAAKKNYVLDEGALAKLRKNLPEIVHKALSINPKDYYDDYGYAEVYLLAARMKREDLKAEIESLGDCTNISTVTLQTCLDACAKAVENTDGAIVMADYHDALTNALECCATDGRALAFFRNCDDNLALRLLNNENAMGAIGDAFADECRWVEAMAYFCR